MPKIKANGITMNYEQQGTGEPLILIPYLSADHACYAFQVAEYAKHFTCIRLTCGGRERPTKPTVPTQPRTSPTMLRPSRKLWGFPASTSQDCHWAPGLGCGWRQSIRRVLPRCRCIAPGRKQICT